MTATMKANSILLILSVFFVWNHGNCNTKFESYFLNNKLNNQLKEIEKEMQQLVIATPELNRKLKFV